MQVNLSLVRTSPALSTVDDAARLAILTATKDCEELTETLGAYEVASTEAAARVTELLTLAGAAANKLEETRDNLVRPLNARVKEINDLVRPLAQAFGEAITVGKNKVLGWKRAEREKAEKAAADLEARRQEEERARAAAAEFDKGKMVPIGQVLVDAVFGDPGGELPPQPPPLETRGIRTDYGTAFGRGDWTYELEDITKVPAEFLDLKRGEVWKAIRQGRKNIPGLRIFQREGISVRAKR
jgi:hypothetical protein